MMGTMIKNNEMVRLLNLLKDAEDDVKNNRVEPIKNTFDELRIELQQNKK